jgi:hypothetical protein
VDLEAGMLFKPAADRGALVRGVVVTDQVHVEIVGDQAVDLLKGASKARRCGGGDAGCWSPSRVRC